MSDSKQAKRYFISGRVQGVGYRYFARAAAEKLHVAGYVRNLVDGRVEVFATGTVAQLGELRKILERGPRFSKVSAVQEESASANPRYEVEFVISPTE